MKRSTKIVLASALGIIILLVSTASALLLWNTLQNKTENSKPAFSFDSSKAPDWWSTDNNYPDIKDFTGDQVTEADLPVVQMTITEGTRELPGECFVFFFYYQGVADTTTELEARKAGLVLGEKDSSALKQVGAVQQTIQTPEGIKEYSLNQFELNLPNTQKGIQFGFIPLSDGYIEVRGNCPTAELLSSTLNAISAVRYDIL